jgi:hypothetical protein
MMAGCHSFFFGRKLGLVSIQCGRVGLKRACLPSFLHNCPNQRRYFSLGQMDGGMEWGDEAEHGVDMDGADMG